MKVFSVPLTLGSYLSPPILSSICSHTSMALPRALGKPRLLLDRYRPASPSVSLDLSLAPPNPAKTNFHRQYITSSSDDRPGYFRRFLHRRALTHRPFTIPEFLSLPVGDKLRDTLRSINITGDRIRSNTLVPPPPPEMNTGDPVHGSSEFSVRDAKKLLRLGQVEKLKAMLREIPETAIPYAEFVRICGGVCGDKDQGLEFAKTLDDSGNVIVLGSVVFLRPDQVAKSMETILSETVAYPGDPRRRELEEMEKEKEAIDEKARAQVRGELYCGLGFMALQTLGFMRLTFWELSWDVMEPICFFVTSLHFAGAYAFFLRTSTEPSFEGYFHRRFNTKQRRLMDLHAFDLQRYQKLRTACRGSLSSNQFNTSPSLGSQQGSFAGPMNR